MKRANLIYLLVALVLLGAAAALLIQSSRPVHEQGSIWVGFCPECEQAFLDFIPASGSLDCAFYDVGTHAGAALKAAGASVITDDETKPAYGKPYKSSGLMHDKFCTNGTTVWTGSYNPTDGGAINQNNVLIIDSIRLASNYENEYRALASKRSRGRIQSDGYVNDIRIENYFCPEDHCEDHVLAALRQAQSEVVFFTFSFTSDAIGDLLVVKTRQGVHVEGICEPSQNSTYSECDRLGAKYYQAPGLLHHKVFVIDKSVVITGSYNPTNNADKNNNENILIIHDAGVAQQFLMEYARLQLDS